MDRRRQRQRVVRRRGARGQRAADGSVRRAAGRCCARRAADADRRPERPGRPRQSAARRRERVHHALAQDPLRPAGRAVSRRRPVRPAVADAERHELPPRSRRDVRFRDRHAPLFGSGGPGPGDLFVRRGDAADVDLRLQREPLAHVHAGGAQGRRDRSRGLDAARSWRGARHRHRDVRRYRHDGRRPGHHSERRDRRESAGRPRVTDEGAVPAFDPRRSHVPCRGADRSPWRRSQRRRGALDPGARRPRVERAGPRRAAP